MADRPSTSITLVVPGLLGTQEIHHQFQALSDEVGDLQALEQLLTQASMTATGVSGLEPTLFSLFAMISDADHDFPVAPLTLYADNGDIPTGCWLRADPVYLQADRDRVLMTAVGGGHLDQALVDRFVNELNDFLQPLGYQLVAPVPQRWYLRLPHEPDLLTSAVNKTFGHDVHAHMPQGRDARQWRALLNEVQMLLHSSEANRRLQDQGARPVNSLWFWGMGTLPDAPARKWDQVWGEDALMKGLALLSGAQQQPLPDDGGTWMARHASDGRHLVVYDELLLAAQSGDFDAWISALGVFNLQWCKPLQQAIKAGQLAAVTLCPGNGKCYEVTPRGLRRWWKRRAGLAGFLDHSDNLYQSFP